IARYTGASPEHAPLHKLGGTQWAKARRKAAEKVRDVAAEILEIHARRAARPGHAFTVDDGQYAAFCQGFPFEETPDQEQAIQAVMDDMMATTTMDRLACGDVGFGKTEVALRAAFIAVDGGKQAAVLVPTTLLAQQHYQTFTDRFADWPVRIELLSRFRSRKEQIATVEGMEDGGVDIVIGTHKLLQSDIKFKQLGLVVVDEEHRFGVRHKESLKALRAEVDMLTLTATPIPRTLNMAFSGMRDLSLIATPPNRRLAVKTFVREWDNASIREACIREIRRGGQIYFVHNKVENIAKVARELGELVPEAAIEVAHGQMRERDLERVMLDFYHRRFNTLICTTIIETGIDVPSANTIIINRADRFGLAQLHQLRGRVGRSHHRAYAYLVVPPRRSMTSDAVKRLDAIESLEELGIGFTLATHDLEIRGAGEVLGEEQSGQINEVGYTLYTQLLERAVAALKAGKTPELDRPLDHGVEIDVHLPALIPDTYLPDVHARLMMYKRIASAASEGELDELQVEMIDRFGLFPEQVRRLFSISSLKLKAASLGIKKIDFGAKSGRIVFDGEDAQVDPVRLVQLVQSRSKVYRFDGPQTLRVQLQMEDAEIRLKSLDNLLDQLTVRDAA
ncbi:MAG: transcription-repair coupling factor, partial [Chromatiales bacterium]|nr:transcription-repair coupling factor [Chromatiales bacterium]